MNSIKKTIEIKWRSVIEFLAALLLLSGVATIARELKDINDTLKDYHPIEVFVSPKE